MKRDRAKHDRLAKENVDAKAEVTAFSMQSRPTLADDASNLKNLNDVHVAEIFSPPRATAESHRFGLTPGMLFDIRTGWTPENANKKLQEEMNTKTAEMKTGSQNPMIHRTPHGSETTSLHQLDELNDVSLENLVEEERR